MTTATPVTPVTVRGMTRRTRNTIITIVIVLLLLCCLCSFCGGGYYIIPWAQARINEIRAIPSVILQPTPYVLQPTPYVLEPTPFQVQPTSMPAQATTVPGQTPSTGIDINETLSGSLDDFGVKARHSDRFALAGTIMDESYNPGEILVGNAYAVHDNGFVSQDGCVVFYYQAPANGGRVRFVGYDGQFFEFDSEAITLNQAIAAMRETLTRAHGCTNIEYHELIRYGDPVK